MLDKDKMIIVYYIDCSGIVDVYTVGKYVADVRNYLSSEFDNSIHSIVVPCRSGLEHNKVECLRPDLMSEEQIQKFNEYAEQFYEFINNKD